MTMILLAVLAVAVVGSGVVAWRLSRCPVFGILLAGMGSWAARCTARRSADILPFPTQPPRRPMGDPPIVHAARRVA